MSGIHFDGNSNVNNQQQVQGSQIRSERLDKLEELLFDKSKLGNASRRITNKNIENALMEPSGNKAVKGLLSNSPIGLTQQPAKEEIENMGFTFRGTAFHHGAPMIYESADGGTITVYDGKGSAEAGEDKRKIVYQNGRYTQEMYYDENGNLTGGKITIKDEVAGFTEKQYDFNVSDNKITSLIQ